jgi:hypothetical protein
VPLAEELVIVPTGKLEPGTESAGKLTNCALAPAKPPSTLLPPPVTAPLAELPTKLPSLSPANPPATLASPTVTLPLACELPMAAVLKTACPSPTRQPSQLKVVCELDATNPPALLPLPANTLPKASENTIAPLLSPTRPPACRFAVARLPTCPRANEYAIRP